MSSFFGSRREQQTQAPTGFQTLPRFGQEALSEVIQSGRGFLQDPSIFTPTQITPEQQEALEVLRLGAQPLTAERFSQQRNIFQNPFIEEVINPALADLREQGQSLFGESHDERQQPRIRSVHGWGDRWLP